MVEDEDRRSGEPLAVELTPDSLTPARVGHGQVERTLVEVVPEHTRRQVSHGIEVVVGHHLRLTARAAGEVHQHGVLIVVHVLRTYELRGLLPLALPVVEALRDGLAMIGHSNQSIHRRTFRHGQLDLLRHIGIIHTDNGLDRGTGVTIDDIFLGQHVGGRNHDGTDLAQGEHDDPPLIAALQDEHHGVVLADAKRHQIGSGLIALLLQLSVGCANLVTLIVRPQEGQFLRGLLSPGIHHVVCEVEALRDDELQVLVVILYRLEMRLL